MRNRQSAKIAEGPPLPIDRMDFRVGPHTFRAVRADRPIYDEEGQELEGRAIERGRLLIVSPAVEPARIEEVVRHEHYHAWRFYVPKPRTEEERAQFVAFIGEQFERDLEAGGGRDALLELPLIRLPAGGLQSPRRMITVLRKVLEHVEKDWDRLQEQTRQEEDRLLFDRVKQRREAARAK